MIVLWIIPILLTLHYILFILTIFRGISKVSVSARGDDISEKITIIIPFRNEANVIEKLIHSINNLNYEGRLFQVIFVDDFSTDDTHKVIEKKIEITNWRIIRNPFNDNSKSYKKSAIAYAIDQSEGDLIFLTDADCVLPVNWLKRIVPFFNEKTAMVSAPVVFNDESNLFQQLQKLEHAALVLTGAGLIGSGFPTICSSANLAFRKSVFYEVNGFDGNINLASGDDEFLMQKIAADTDYNIKFCMQKDALVLTRSNRDLSEFSNQRKRWASKGLYYKNKFLVAKLTLIFLYYVLLAIVPILIIIVNQNMILLLLFMLVSKFVPEYLVMLKGVNILYDKSLLRNFLLAEIFHVPYIIYSVIGGAIGGFVWKGRRIRR